MAAGGAESEKRREAVSGTVARVLHPGGNGTPWRGIVYVREGRDGKDTYVERYISLEGSRRLNSGDDIYLLCGDVDESRQGRLPKKLNVKPWPVRERAAFAAASGMRFSEVVEHVGPHGPGNLAEWPTLVSAAAAVREGVVRGRIDRSAIVIQRGAVLTDPVLDAVVRRFNEPRVRAWRGSFTLVVDHSVMLSRTVQPTSKVMDWLRAESSVFSRRSGVPIGDLMPATMDAAQRDWIADKVDRGLPATEILDAKSRAEVYRSGVIVPSTPLWSGVATWMRVADLGPEKASRFFPTTVPQPDTWSRFFLAHELAHRHQDAVGIPSKGDLADRRRAESFSDVAALMAFVLDTGAIEDARAIAAARSLAFFQAGNQETYFSGMACWEAVRVAEQVRQRRADREDHPPVSMAAILTQAKLIAEAATPPSDQLSSRLRSALNARHPDWPTMTARRLARAVTACAQAVAKDLTTDGDRQMLASLSHSLTSGLEYAFTVAELSSRRKAERARDIYRTSLQASLERLERLGCGAAIGAFLDGEAQWVAAVTRAWDAPTPHRNRSYGILARLMPFGARQGAVRQDAAGWAALADASRAEIKAARVGDRATKGSAPAHGDLLVSVDAAVRRPAKTNPWDLPLKQRAVLFADISAEMAKLAGGFSHRNPRASAIQERFVELAERRRDVAYSLCLEDADRVWMHRLDNWIQQTNAGMFGFAQAIERCATGNDLPVRRLPLPEDDRRLLLADARLTSRVPGRAAPPPADEGVRIEPLQNGGVKRVLEVNGRLHCRDGWALETLQGRRAAVNGEPAFTVELMGGNGAFGITRLMTAAEADAFVDRVRDGTVVPADALHIAALQRAARDKYDGEIVPLDPSRPYVAEAGPVRP